MWQRGLSRRRLLALAAITVTSGLVPAAHAAQPAAHSPKTACRHLITDRRGDAQEWFLPTAPYNPEADLLYVDASTSARTVDFTIGLASVNPVPTTGTDITVYFLTNNQGRKGDWYVDIDHAVDGTDYSVQDNLTNQVTVVSGAASSASNTFVVHVPRSDIDATYRGAVLSGLGVIVSQVVGVTKANGGFIEQSTGPGYHYRVGYRYGCD